MSSLDEKVVNTLGTLQLELLKRAQLQEEAEARTAALEEINRSLIAERDAAAKPE